MANQPDQKEQEALQRLRDKIDKLDLEIHKKLNSRAELAQEVAKLKLLSSKDPDHVTFYRPEREAQLLRKIMQRNQGPLADQTVALLFREIMSACLALEQVASVVYLGPVATFTHAAALKHFGHGVSYQPSTSIDEVFRQVESGAARYGVVPVENSTEGMVNYTLDCLLHSPLKICGEVALSIHHHLLVKKDAQKDQIQQICSHQQSLAQCRRWLDRFWPHTVRTEVYSTAEAARRAQKDPTVAAIASDMAIEHYGLVPLASCIEDYSDNKTRFIVVSHQAPLPSGKDKTSILVYTRNKPGALYHLLASFYSSQINLTRIETRPAPGRGKWSYVFFMDFNGHEDDDQVKQLFQEIDKSALEIKNLGSYPQDVFE